MFEFINILCYTNKKGGGSVRKITILAFALVAFLALGFVCSCGVEEAEGDVMPAKVDVLKVGKADCIVINTGTKIIMIDTAEKENLDDIRSFMREKGYEKVDTLILTHYDKDHIGCAKEIIEEYGVETVLENSFSSDSELFHEYHYALKQQGKSAIRLNEDYSFRSDSCDFVINVPRQKKYETKKDNNSSLVVKMECGETCFLFCGDAEELRLTEIIDTCAGKYDFVKIPYHGNYLENYPAFLEKIKVGACALTCSKKNPADPRTLEALESSGAEIYETKNGTVHVETDGRTVAISQ